MKLKFIILSVLATSAVMSCTKSGPTSTKETEIIVQADIVQTRAGYDSDMLPQSFVMDIRQGADSKYDYESVLMVKSGTNYVPDNSDIRMLWAGTPYSSVYIKAMTLPINMNVIDAESPIDINVSTEQDTEANLVASDVLVADKETGDISIEDRKVKINFRHLLSKLDIICKFGDGLDVDIHSVYLENVCIKGQYSYADMAINPNGELEYDNISMFVDRSGQFPVFEAIFFPYKPTDNPILYVNATIDGEDRDMTCVINPNSNGFVGGKRYTMTVTVNSTSLTPTAETFTIDAQWGDGNNDDDFELDFGTNAEIGNDVFVTD